jgi:hypothetical protein
MILEVSGQSTLRDTNYTPGLSHITRHPMALRQPTVLSWIQLPRVTTGDSLHMGDNTRLQHVHKWNACLQISSS